MLKATYTTDEQNRPLVQIADYPNVVELLDLVEEQLALGTTQKYELVMPQ